MIMVLPPRTVLNLLYAFPFFVSTTICFLLCTSSLKRDGSIHSPDCTVKDSLIIENRYELVSHGF